MSNDFQTYAQIAAPTTAVVASGWRAPKGLDKIAPAWVAALGELHDVPKDKEANAGTYSYPYATLGSALEQVRPTLAKHGLALFQVPTRDGSHVAVQTVVIHESGQVLIFEPLTMPGGNNPQGAGSGITYARRYALMAVCGLATEDDDGKAAQEQQDQPASRSRPPKAPKRTKPEPEIPKGTVGTIVAKKRLAAACEGDTELAADIWARFEFGTDPVPEEKLQEAEGVAADALVFPAPIQNVQTELV